MGEDKRKTRDGIRRRGAGWEVIIYEGAKPAHRCQECGRLFWDDRQRDLSKCPKCGGVLEAITEKRQTSRGGFATQKAAKAARSELVVKVNKTGFVDHGRLTLSEYLRITWLPAIRGTIRASTLDSYTCHVEKHIIPSLGAKRLRDLNGPTLNVFYDELATTGKLIGDGDGLAPASVRRIHATLHRALKDAVRWEYVARNAADAADPPKAKADAGDGSGPTLKYWRPKQLQAFLKSTRDDRLFNLWVFLAATGTRRGEALGLRWEDVTFSQEEQDDAPAIDVAAVSIRRTLTPVNGKTIIGTPKTEAGKRTLQVGPDIVGILRDQARRQGDDADKLGDAWTASGYVFTNEDGSPLVPARVSLLFKRALKAAALPEIPLHGLRHTCGSMMAANGTHPKVVQEWLGHSNVSITLNVYSHAFPGMARDASAKVEALIFGR